MDVKSFQEKLARMVSVAKEQGNQISLTQIGEFMGEDQLDEGQLEKVLVYFKSLNISCEGEQSSQKEEEEEADIVKADPLSAEEEQYLREYEKSLEGVASAGQEEFRKLCQAMDRGEEQAAGRIAELFLPRVIQIATGLHRKDYFLGDMIQEGNMALMAALQAWNPEGDPERWLEKQVRQGLLETLRMKEQQNYQDEALVEKVRKLEAAVRELSEEGEKKFSLEELAVLLDMDVDEIRDVLRLTGDDQ